MVILLPLSLAIVFKKAGRSSWNALQPNWYSSYVLAQIAGLEPGVGTYLNPIRGVNDYSQICLGIAENFGRSPYFGLGLALLPPVFYAILAFNKNIKYKRPGVSDFSTPTSLHLTREYYEKKAAESTQSKSSGEGKSPPQF